VGTEITGGVLVTVKLVSELKIEGAQAGSIA
jgi:hypothetical protein